MSFQGRHRGDVLYAGLPDDVQPGDYWRYVDGDGNPKIAKGSLDAARAAGNLTGGIWGVCCPVEVPNSLGLIGMLVIHTVREEDDGTISVRPGDGSSNSILVDMPPLASWHGYIEHGVWSSV